MPRADKPATDQPRPRARTVVVGTPETIPAAAAYWHAATGAPAVGALTLRPTASTCAGGVRILGAADDAAEARRLHAFEQALLCLPSAVHDGAARISAALRAAGLVVRALPAPCDVAAGSVGAGAIDPTLLLPRPPRAMDDAARARADRVLRGKRVLITGAGGSIGSELALIAAAHAPEELVLMERSENALFEIARMLRARAPGVRLRALLHDVAEERATRAYLQSIRPHVVLHAAAHKHVPIMEDHPALAVRNNVFGTKAIADAAHECGVERFVMISTDKAVAPRSVMGATKRFAERYVRSLNHRTPPTTPGATPHSGATPHRAAAGVSSVSPTRFRMVRFGNVLGSAGSVGPIWARQIAEGGPVTVTHPEMTRYFMTIHEAAWLVVQAAALDRADSGDTSGGGGADIFVLDMGEPVRIVELAERFIRLHGFEPRFADNHAGAHHDAARPPMDIVFTGARPGEKLHEALAHAQEELRPTAAHGVMALNDAAAEPICAVDALIADLDAVQTTLDHAAALDVIRRHSPGVAPDAPDAPHNGADPETADKDRTNKAGAGLHAA